MLDALSGFFLVAVMMIVGYIAARTGVVLPGQERVISRLTYYVLAPCLLFTVLLEADLRQLFSSLLGVSVIAALATFVVFLFLGAFVLRRRGADLVIGMLASGYTNAGTLGIPVAVYFLDSAAYVAPIILLQAVVFTPATLAILDTVTGTGAHSSRWRSVVGIAANPVILATLLGIGFSLFRVEVPTFVMTPIALMGDASVPLVLIAFGMSFAGTRVLGHRASRPDTVLSSSLKVLLMPAISWVVGLTIFGLSGTELYAVTLLGALPTAGNVFTFAQRYDRGEMIARDTGLLTTVASLPALLLITLLLNPT